MMFGSPIPFGQTSSSPFGSSGFRQTIAPTNNPFGLAPFGTPTAFGRAAIGGTSTDMFRAPQTSSPFQSTTTFGASSSPAFGSSMPAFGASSTPAFNSSSSSFGGSSVFGQNAGFGGFGSSTTPSPFGGTNQQSQPASGSSLFCSATPFGAGSQPGFGGTNTLSFGSTSNPAFSSTSSPVFGAASTPAFGSTASPAFGSTGSAFDVSSTPDFGSSNTSFFCSSSTPSFGASSSPVFGAARTPAFGAPSAQTFGASSTPSFTFASNSAFGQSTSAFGSCPFGASASEFGSQSFSLGSRATKPALATSGFGQATFVAQQGGSRQVTYTTTAEKEINGAGRQHGKLDSISAMAVYRKKSHEELRWEDYQSGDKGYLPVTKVHETSGLGAENSVFGSQATTTATFASSGFGQAPFAAQRGVSREVAYTATAETEGQPGKLESISAVPAYKEKSHEELRWEDYQLGDKGGPLSSGQQPGPICFRPPTSTPAFGSTSTPAFGATSTPAFGSTASPAFGSTGSAFGVSSTPGFGSSNTSVFGLSSTPSFGASSSHVFGVASTPAFGASSAQTFGASSTPSFTFASNSAFGQSTSAFGSSPFGAQSSAFGSQATTPTFASSGFEQATSGGRRGGSRAVAYTATADTETTGTWGQPGKFESISVMPAYNERSHEELRWEDYQLGDKGGPPSSGQQPGALSFNAPAAQSNPFALSSTFPQTSTNPFSSSTPSNPFATKAFAPSATSAFSSAPFSAPVAANPFQATSFPSSSSGAFASTSPSPFGPSSLPSFASTPSVFTPTAQGTTSAFNPTVAFPNSSSTFFQSTTPWLPQTSSMFASIGQGSSLPFGPYSTPATSHQGSLFSSASSLFPSTNPVSTAAAPFLGQCSSCRSRGAGNLFSITSGQKPLPSAFGEAPFGSRGVPYTATNDTDRHLEKLESISAMAVYKEKSHEELRLDDYQWGDKGGPIPSVQPPCEIASTGESNAVAPSSTSTQPCAHPSSSPTPADQSYAPYINGICTIFVVLSLNQ